MDNSEEFIFCSRCGSRMKKEQRCCIKCGNLNFLNDENKSMRKFVKPKLFSRKVSVNKFINGEATSSDVLYADRAGSREVCLTFNLICYVIEIVLFVLVTLFNTNGTMNYFTLSIALIFLTFFKYSFLGLQLCFMKSNLPWWSAYVPFYNLYNWFLMTMGNGWLFLVMFIPVIGQIFLLISYWNFGNSFGKNGLLTLLFFPFVVGNIGFDISAIYNETSYVYTRRQVPNYFLKIYKTNSRIVFIFEMIMLICTIYFFYVLLIEFGIIK